ncbi:hypothetical protein K7X08_010655 [Anisodus acutangulus]|uniref:Uncharacterized protein n=1 Tax=Anisodus acutangulus TaxID=402998 RepID=A0A9Q1RA03_9SOLA|nr:hypothetical protein K7X08_010655 [Anisodus acutangulus]
MPTNESILATEQVDVNQHDNPIVDAGGFGSQIQIETFQNTSLDSDILSHEETRMPIDENFVIAPSDVGLSFVTDVGAIAVSDKVEQFDVLQIS